LPLRIEQSEINAIISKEQKRPYPDHGRQGEKREGEAWRGVG
jgi:hypothetical protein